MRLFNRSPREVTLTEEGRRFHAQVIPLLAGLEEAAADAAGAAAVVTGRLVGHEPEIRGRTIFPIIAVFGIRL